MTTDNLPLLADIEWSEVLEFLPVFEDPEFVAGTIETEPLSITPWTYAPEVHDFIATLYRLGVIEPFGWSAWQPRAVALYSDADELAAAELEEMRKLLTLHVRKDRFVDGHLGGMISDGHIEAVLRRIAILTAPSSGQEA